MSWPVKKFSSLVSPSGVFADGDWVESKDQDPNGEVRLVQLADVGVNEFIDKSSRFMTHEAAERLRCTFLEPGDILIARMPDPIGRACVFPGDTKPCVTVVDVCIVRPCSDEIDSCWLVHLINSDKFHHQILQHVTGTTRQRISRGNLSKLEVEVPPLAEQRGIAAILDKADALRRKRQQAIDLADQFLRSVFLEMFGDPVSNPKGWKTLSLGELASKIGSGATPRGGKSAYVDQGISLIRSMNIHDNKFVNKELAFINEDQAELLSNVVVKTDDVLLNITGASVCRCAIVPREVLPARVNQHVCILRTNADLILPLYLLHLLISGPFKQYLLSMAGAGATREALTKQQIKDLVVPVPPSEKQEKFVEVVNRIESAQGKAGRSSADLESLFASLSQQAFRGEL